MLTWDQLRQNLDLTSRRHMLLSARFENFAKFFTEQVTAQGFFIKGITTSLAIEQGFFTLAVFGRILRFDFSSPLSESGSLIGTVTCSLVKDFPEKASIRVGQFTFSGEGKTNLNNPEYDEPIVIDDDFPSLYIGLHFVFEALSK